MRIGRCKLLYCPIHGPIVRCQQTKGLRLGCHGTTLYDRCNGDGGTVGKHARVAAAVTPRNARRIAELRAPAARLERYHLFRQLMANKDSMYSHLIQKQLHHSSSSLLD
jgi:hypothetical protein